MSRVGKKPIKLPKGVEVKQEAGNLLRVKGAKGQLQLKLHDLIKVEIKGDTVNVLPKNTTKENRRYHGMSRTLIANMVEGVSTGYSKSLSLVGVGYRAAMKGKELSLTLGYSHPVDFMPPAGIDIKVDKQTTVIVSGPDKHLVGQVAAKIRSFRKPEPYHGKGVRYADEQIITKVGKSGGAKTA